jgi:hypothetical protein
MFAPPQQCSTLLEIVRHPDGDVPVRLIRAAYLASRSEAVMLALNCVTRAEVDRALDPVVAHIGIDVRGVVYADLADDGFVLRAAARAQRVFAASDAFRAKLRSRGIAYRDSADLERDADDPSGHEPKIADR